MLNWKIEARKQEITLKKCNELFVYYLSRAVFLRHIAHFTHSVKFPDVVTMATVPRGVPLQRGEEEEEIENGNQVSGSASMHRDNRKREPQNLLEEM